MRSSSLRLRSYAICSESQKATLRYYYGVEASSVNNDFAYPNSPDGFCHGLLPSLLHRLNPFKVFLHLEQEAFQLGVLDEGRCIVGLRSGQQDVKKCIPADKNMQGRGN